MSAALDLRAVFADPPEACAVLVRAQGRPEVYVGSPVAVDDTAQLCAASSAVRAPLVFALPYATLGERGYDHPGGGEPILALAATASASPSRAELVQALPSDPVECRTGGFVESDEAYAASVRRVVEHEIGQGAGSNFVLCRTLRAQFTGDVLQSCLRLLRELLVQEHGAYWTFLLRVGDRVLVGASPEVHLRVTDGQAVLNPISGTHRYHPSAPVAGLERFVDCTMSPAPSTCSTSCGPRTRRRSTT